MSSPLKDDHMMQYQMLGRSNIKVSKITLGCMSFHTRDEAVPIIKEALDAGINSFDTADLYDQGDNERILGKILKANRSEVVIATKVGNCWRPDGSGWDWMPNKAYIMKAAEDSLKRLGTDYIDVYQLHGGTIDDPLDEVVNAFEELKSQGKIRTYGISSIRPNTIRKWCALASGDTCMTQYSVLDRRAEEQNFEVLAAHHQSVLVRGALAKGLLVSKKPHDYLIHQAKDVEKIQQQLKLLTSSPAGGAVAFALAPKAVASVVLGASRLGQLSEVVRQWRQLLLEGVNVEEWKDIVPVGRYQKHR